MHIIRGFYWAWSIGLLLGITLADIFFDWDEKGFLMRQIMPRDKCASETAFYRQICFGSAAYWLSKWIIKHWSFGKVGLPDLLFFFTTPITDQIDLKTCFGCAPQMFLSAMIDPCLLFPGDRLNGIFWWYLWGFWIYLDKCFAHSCSAPALIGVKLSLVVR